MNFAQNGSFQPRGPHPGSRVWSSVLSRRGANCVRGPARYDVFLDPVWLTASEAPPPGQPAPSPWRGSLQRGAQNFCHGSGCGRISQETRPGQLGAFGPHPPSLVSTRARGPAYIVGCRQKSPASRTDDATEDELLTATHGLNDEGGLGAISWQWNRNDQPIAGATESTYTLSQLAISASHSPGSPPPRPTTNSTGPCSRVGSCWLLT